MTNSRPSDRCPGVLRLHPAADGLLARIRIPGGRMDPEKWTRLAAAARLGDGQLYLTSRGNIQVRGLTQAVASEFESLLAAADLAPDPGHDRMRNILASPLAGRLPGRAPLGSLVSDLAAELVTRPGLSDASLSGKFLFGLDDASGDILRHGPDLGAQLGFADDAELIIGGWLTGLWVHESAVPTMLADLAESFAALPAHGWRITGDPGAADAVVAAAREHPGIKLQSATAPAHPDAAAAPPVGWIDAVDGTVSLLAVTKLGIVDARLAEFLGAIETASTVSPDRVIGIHGLTEDQAEQVVRVLAPMGLIFDAESPWVNVTACIGAPGCGSSLAPVHADLADAALSGSLESGPQHWVGCERACGWDHRADLHIATGDGYVRRSSPRLDDAPASPERPADAP